MHPEELDTFFVEPVDNQIDRLAIFILQEFPDWPGNAGISEGVIDCAMRIMMAYKMDVGHPRESSRLIAIDTEYS